MAYKCSFLYQLCPPCINKQCLTLTWVTPALFLPHLSLSRSSPLSPCSYLPFLCLPIVSYMPIWCPVCLSVLCLRGCGLAVCALFHVWDLASKASPKVQHPNTRLLSQQVSSGEFYILSPQERLMSGSWAWQQQSLAVATARRHFGR